MELAIVTAPPVPANHVIVDFGDAVHPDLQGAALLFLEKYLRTHGAPDAEAFKRTAPDDSKLRLRMDQAAREKL